MSTTSQAATLVSQDFSKTAYKFSGSTPNFPTNTQSKLSHPGTIVLSRLKMTTRREGLIIPPLSICIKAALSLKIGASNTWYLSAIKHSLKNELHFYFMFP